MSFDEFSPAFSTAFDPSSEPPEPPFSLESCVPWTPDMACCDEWSTDAFAVELKSRAVDLAWATLRTLTGGRVGNCPVTVRPCLGPPCDYCAKGWLNPMIVNGEWVNYACGRSPCWCARLCEIVLPGPIASVEEVMLDGEALVSTAYVVQNGNRLVRVDGECWPSCQYADRALTEPGTLGVTYVPGIDPGAAGLWAAGVLTCEFAKACSGGKCRLPASVTAIARQGVAFTMTTGMFEGNVTGIREVDAFVFSVNPHGHRTPPKVWSPDVPWGRHRYEALETP